MRSALVLLVLLLTACGNTTGDGRRTANIDKSYKVRDACLARNAAALIVAHGHPSGEATPSQADEAVTLRLKEALALVDVRLLDHCLGGL